MTEAGRRELLRVGYILRPEMSVNWARTCWRFGSIVWGLMRARGGVISKKVKFEWKPSIRDSFYTGLISDCHGERLYNQDEKMGERERTVLECTLKNIKRSEEVSCR